MKALSFSILVLLLVVCNLRGLAEKDKPLKIQTNSCDVAAIRFLDDGQSLLVADANQLRLFDVETGRHLVDFPVMHVQPILSVDITHDGALVATCGKDGKVVIWDIVKAAPLKVFENENAIITVVKFSIDGNFLFYGGTSRNLIVVDLLSLSVLKQYDGFSDDLLTIESMVGAYSLAVGTFDGKIWLFNENFAQKPIILQPGYGAVRALQYAQATDLLYIATDDGVLVSKLNTGGKLTDFDLAYYSGWITAFSFFQDKNSFVFGTTSGYLGVHAKYVSYKYRFLGWVKCLDVKPLSESLFIVLAVSVAGEGVFIVKGTSLKNA